MVLYRGRMEQMSFPKSMMPMTRTMPGRISERRLAASRILRFFLCFRIGSTMSVLYGAESGAGNAMGKAALDGGEGIILRLTEKFDVVREGEMPRRESGPTQLDERGVSVIRLLLPPTSGSLLWDVMAFCTIQRRREMVTNTEVSGIDSGAGDLYGSRFPISVVKLSS